ncbi:MAG: BspA family leucine-rich repeat surface protein, partial [Salinispira sp.]
LQHREVGASAWEPAIATADADTLTLSITDLTKGAEYEARVYAVNGQGNGNPTEIKKATIPATKPSAMNAPALTVGDTQLTATWTAPDDGGSTITAYEVLYKVSTASGWTQDNETIAGTAVSYTITGLTNGSRWQVRVRAVNEVGDGGWSASAVKRLLPSATQVPSGGTAASVILSATIDDAIANAENPSVTVAGLTSGTSVTLPTVGSSTGVITVTATTTAGIYVVSGLDGGGNELFPSEKFYVTANPQTNAKLVTAVTEGIDTWGNTADFNYIVTTAVTNMNGVFLSKSSFNGDISGWDTGAVTTMYRMFRDAHVFNGDISGWDVSKVTTMRWMFRDARVFNGDISGWDTGAVTNMSTMFNKAFLFNGDISGWDVSKVTDMSLMFTGASAFNGNISGWDVSSVTDMSSMFLDASAFNQNLENWGTHLTGRTVDKTSMFAGSGLDGTEPSWY